MHPSEENCYVYVLIHVEKQEVFYVGRGTTQNGRFDRERMHWHNARTGSALPVHRKMRSLMVQNQNIKFEVRCTGLTYEESVEVERKLIIAFGLDHLTNVLADEKEKRWQGRECIVPDGRTNKVSTPQELAALQTWREKESRPVWVRDRLANKVYKFPSQKLAARILQCDVQSIKYRINGGGTERHSNKFNHLDFSFTPFQ